MEWVYGDVRSLPEASWAETCRFLTDETMRCSEVQFCLEIFSKWEFLALNFVLLDQNSPTKRKFLDIFPTPKNSG